MNKRTTLPDGDNWHPSILVALINQSGITFRWVVGGLAAIFVTVNYLPSCDCELTQDVKKALLFCLAFCILCIFVGIVGFMYGRGQRAFRFRKTKELATRIVELEERIDPQRSSSGLDPTGATNPKDLK